jgi:hypothetical protein
MHWNAVWSQPNELGDFAAGFFAPLAFMWLIFGYFLQKTQLDIQGQELKQNTEALFQHKKRTGPDR